MIFVFWNNKIRGLLCFQDYSFFFQALKDKISGSRGCCRGADCNGSSSMEPIWADACPDINSDSSSSSDFDSYSMSGFMTWYSMSTDFSAIKKNKNRHFNFIRKNHEQIIWWIIFIRYALKILIIWSFGSEQCND